MSDEEFNDEDYTSSEEVAFVDDDEKEALESIRNLSRDKANVGKSLRRIADDENGQVVKKSKVFRDEDQLATGKRERANIADLMEEKDEEESEDEMQEEEVDEEEDDDGPQLIKASMLANPAHVRNQRKTEADILGVRIRLQGLLSTLFKLPSDLNIVSGNDSLRSIIESLLEMRESVFDHGHQEYDSIKRPSSVSVKTKSCDKIWNEIEGVDNHLWSRHQKVISAWERRAHLSVTKGKELRAMNKSAMEQTQAALARRAEIGSIANFQQEDSDFYQNLLRDFVQARSADALAGPSSKALSKRQQYKLRFKNKELKVNHEIREKMVNFATTVSFPPPPIDVDQLVASLFRT